VKAVNKREYLSYLSREHVPVIGEYYHYYSPERMSWVVGLEVSPSESVFYSRADSPAEARSDAQYLNGALT